MTELMDTLWVVTAAALVFIMQAGFSFLESGLTRSKNSINVAIKNLTDLGVSIMAYWIFGFALMFGVSRLGVFGSSGFLFSANGEMWPAAFFLFQAMFCSTAATIVSGAVAERMRYISYIAATVLLAALIYPVLGHWVWGSALRGGSGGWLESLGFIDFAGSTVVHSTGGWIALAALLILGPRAGRFGVHGRRIPGSNIPTAVVGVMLLWFGWFGFNGGSTLGLTPAVPGILVNTAIAAAAGMVFALVIGWPLMGHPDIGLVLNGSLAGLVAITAAAPYVVEWQAVVIGGSGGVVMLIGTLLLERLEIDDAVGAIPVHLAAGIWGTLAVALFGDPQLLGTGLSMPQQLAVQGLGIGVIGAWAFWVPLGLLRILNRYLPLRVTPAQEESGLNVAEHGATTEAYDLFNVMNEHKLSGDLTRRVPVEPFTEVGAIARQYNAVLDNLSENLVAKSEYLNILDNVSDGLFLIDEQLLIAPFYSRTVASILEVGEPGGASLSGMLQQLLPERKLQSVLEFLQLCFSNTVDHRTVLKLNPLQQEEFFFDAGDGTLRSKHLQWSFTRVSGSMDGRLRLMVLVRDVTEQIELGNRVEKQRLESASEMELLYRILHVDPEMLREFIELAESNIVGINDVLESGAAARRLDTLFERAHRIKGDATLLRLDFIAARANDLEEQLVSLRRRTAVQNDDFLPLTITMSHLVGTLNRAKGVTRRLAQFQQSFAQYSGSGDSLLSETLRRTAARAAEDLGKQVELDISLDIQALSPGLQRGLRDALVQLVRNAVAHGIESPDERRRRGKPERGVVRITSPSERTVAVRDDGGGLDIAELKQRAAASGNYTAEQVEGWTAADAAKLIFAGGVSTADESGAHAGRGVGMGVVGSVVRSFGGRIAVVYQPGRYTEFTLAFPVAAAEADAATAAEKTASLAHA